MLLQTHGWTGETPVAPSYDLRMTRNARSPHQKRILFPFLSYCFSRAMAGNYDRLNVQTQNAVADRGHQFLEVSHRQIAAAETSRAHPVLGNQEYFRWN